jgi:hypothetical protein
VITRSHPNILWFLEYNKSNIFKTITHQKEQNQILQWTIKKE